MADKEDKAAYAKPDSFDGDQAKLENFIHQLSLYFRGNTKSLRTDEEKITFALGYMKQGRAIEWAKRYEKARNDGNLAAPLLTWTGFAEELNKEFEDTNPKTQAQYKIHNLRQGKHPVEAYTAEFKRWAAYLNYGEDVLINLYRRGLDDKLADAIMSRDKIPDNIKEWYELAHRLAHNWRERDLLKRQFQDRAAVYPTVYARPQLRTSLPTNYSSYSNNQVVPMDVDKTRFGTMKK